MEMTLNPIAEQKHRKFWGKIDYRTVWRWHFYAGLIAIPFVLLLSISGSIYLFRPQIEAWLDRPHDSLTDALPRQAPSAIVKAAVAAVPGSSLNALELPDAETDAARVLLNTPEGVRRVYVHPRTLAVLSSVLEQSRPMRWIFRLHGELLIGNVGSYIVEIAASWTIVLILTGLWLWWPRNREGWGGVLYPRIRGGSRTMWRDLHGVTGFWISALVLLLLFSGLPWAKFWGDYFRFVRTSLNGGPVKQGWTNGAAVAMEGMDMPEMGGMHGMSHEAGFDNAALDRVYLTATTLEMASPVQIKPPARVGADWGVESQAANRPLRAEVKLDSDGRVLTRSGFSDKSLADKIVGVGIAWHEGQLFGWLNQLLGVTAAAGLILICLSAIVLWWRRRPTGLLGAPPPAEGRRGAGAVTLATVGLGIVLPLFAMTLLAVWSLEAGVLRRFGPTRRWLGLRPA